MGGRDAFRLLTDFVVFNPVRFGWRLLGFRHHRQQMVPLVLGRALELLRLYLAGLAAYPLAFADWTDD